MMRRAFTKAASAPFLVQRSRPILATVNARLLSNITYSGGQATEGQGGFYGSGGARVTPGAPTTEHRPELLAIAADVHKIVEVMDEVERLESLLNREQEEAGGDVTGKGIEISSNIKKLMTSPEFMDCLNRLEIQGEPVWGLSSNERDLITAARAKVNEC